MDRLTCYTKAICHPGAEDVAHGPQPPQPGHREGSSGPEPGPAEFVGTWQHRFASRTGDTGPMATGPSCGKWPGSALLSIRLAYLCASIRIRSADPHGRCRRFPNSQS